jgi:hypothetical protein
MFHYVGRTVYLFVFSLFNDTFTSELVIHVGSVFVKNVLGMIWKEAVLICFEKTMEL